MYNTALNSTIPTIDQVPMINMSSYAMLSLIECDWFFPAPLDDNNGRVTTNHGILQVPGTVYGQQCVY